ncbi:MAG: fasciclin domain-containing protein [Bacteroidaceae bacterium]|nr:fasciclin domain-containing protein [Bacteroidaceae bacterium]MBQ6226214.1 fasciclin domain-containing protein [Bacteroidaceae bacterium]
MLQRKWIWLCLGFVTLLTACHEDIDTSARYVFTERTIASYLDDHAQFSEYVRLLKEQPVSDVSKTSVYQLMTAYGYYTCFAPTNDAIQMYLDSLVIKGIIPEASWDAFPSERARDSVRAVIVLNSILDGTKQERTYISAEFPKTNEEFAINTMADRKISVTYYKQDLDSMSIDGICPVSKKNRDIEAINGYIHQLGYVINPSNETLGSTLHKYAFDYESGLSVMANLIETCGLIDTLTKVRDERYEVLYKTGAFPSFKWQLRGWEIPAPEHRKYGFTLFAETDDFWEAELGKDRRDIKKEDVIAWLENKNYYPDAVNDDDYRNENNLLNQFVTYHLLPQRIPVDKLALHYNEKGYNYKLRNASPTVPVWAHYVTFGKRRLLRIWESAESQGPYLNRFPKLNKGRREDYHESECAEENLGVEIRTDETSGIVKLINAIIYPIHEPIAYTENVRNQLAKQRLRYDAWELQPEAMNNDMRLVSQTDAIWYFSSDPDKQYFENATVNSKQTHFMLLSGRDQSWPNYQGDELLAEGVYDITITLPPVPKFGVYEIRMGVSTYSGTRGICQVYWGPRKDQLVAQGIPVNMQLGGNSSGNMLGWEVDTDDDDYNAEVDKKMRNNGFLKGPEYIVASAGGRETNRMNAGATRRIVVRESMSPDVQYYMRFKTVQPDYTTKQLFVDYLEWCPKEVYDNPETPEDIW